MTDRFESLLNEFQDSLHDALQAFLNGTFVVLGSPRRISLLAPLRLGSQRVPWLFFAPAMERLRDLSRLSQVSGTGIERMAKRGEQRRWLPFAEAAEWLSAAYGALESLIQVEESTGATHREVRILRCFSNEVYEERGLGAIVGLVTEARRKLTPYLSGFYLHGSLSTLDYTPFSDADDFMIVSRATVLNRYALQACAHGSLSTLRFLYEHDTYHHHGHFAVTEIDLQRYAPAYLPPEVLEFATLVFGNEVIPMQLRRFPGAIADRLEDLAKGILHQSAAGTRTNVWHLKFLAAAIMLVPVLYLETKGTFVYKKFSFDRAQPIFGESWRAVEIASQLRERWSVVATPRERLLRTVALSSLRNPPLFEHLMRRAAQPLPPSLKSWVSERSFFQHAHAFARRTLDLIGTEGAPTPSARDTVLQAAE